MRQHYTWRQFDKDVDNIVRRIKQTHRKFDGVWGPPRGGLPLAVVLSHALNIPLLTKPEGARTLIVDDLADTGATLKKFYKKNFIATLLYHPQSVTIPDIWVHKKGKAWILFPWEKSGKP